MTGFDRRTVVLLPFPFSDQSAVKFRPAIVVNTPFASKDLLVVGVSSAISNMLPGEFAIRFWRESGLIHASFVKRAVATVTEALVRKRLGQLRPGDLDQVDSALRLWFG